MVTRRIENLKILPRLHERVQAKAPPTSRAHRRTAPCTCISDFQSCSEVRLSGATNQAKSCHITWAERASKRDPSTPRWTGPVRVQRIFHRHPVYSATAFAAADVDADADAAAAGCPALLNRNPTKLRTTRSSGTCLHLCFAEFPPRCIWLMQKMHILLLLLLPKLPLQLHAPLGSPAKLVRACYVGLIRPRCLPNYLQCLTRQVKCGVGCLVERDLLLLLQSPDSHSPKTIWNSGEKKCHERKACGAPLLRAC